MVSYLEFEKPIADLEGKIAELRHVAGDSEINIASEITRLQKKVDRMLTQTYKDLSAHQVVQVARHPERPHFSDYIDAMITDFTPLAGDRVFGEDHALIGGLGRFQGQSCVVMGQEKGSDTDSRIKHNFGMARPEGYRKAQRLVKMAEQFKLPVLTFVDTAGAYPGVGAEERGQSEAIARSINDFVNARIPILSVVIGEGGSGGAIAIAGANKVYMPRYSVYSVISPEGCASILWRSASYAEQASDALRLTAEDLYDLGVIDAVIDEPVGGGHRFREQLLGNVETTLAQGLEQLSPMTPEQLRTQRHEKFLAMGRVESRKK